MSVFQLTDNCSKLTHKIEASALDSQHAMQNVAGMIQNLRSDDHFERHYQTAFAKATERDIDPPVLRRTSRPPARYDDVLHLHSWT